MSAKLAAARSPSVNRVWRAEPRARVTERLRELQIDKIYLEVRLSNAIGRRLYARAGFRELGTRRGYYPAAQGREDALVMELPLRALPS